MDLVAHVSARERDGLLVAYNGVCRPIEEWAELKGLAVSVLFNRLFDLRWSRAEAFETPLPAGVTVERYRKYTHAGKTMDLRGWAVELGVPLTTLKDRLARGFSFARVFTAKSARKKKRARRALAK